MPLTLRSYAKVNIGLRIGPARADGFHALATLYHTLDAHDLLTVELRRGEGIHLSSNDPRVPLDGRNTVHRMLTRALAGRPGIEARVHISKRLPIQGGLGGGSGNAVAALLGLERELARLGWAAPLPEAEQLRIASEVGSDVSLFVLGGAVLGMGRGELVEPLADGPELPVVVALPDTGVSTPAAYAAWDRDPALTPGAQAARLEEFRSAVLSAWSARSSTGAATLEEGGHAGADHVSELVQAGLCTNDFESVVFPQNPLLGQLKEALARPRGAYASLSGSGSAVFGMYPDEGSAREAEGALAAMRVRCLRTRLLGRARYGAEMAAGG